MQLVSVQGPLPALLQLLLVLVTLGPVSYCSCHLTFTYLTTAATVLFGFMAGTICNFATQLKFVFGYDDTLDIFATHAIGGLVGNLLTGLFTQSSVAEFDGSLPIPGGWLDHNYKQLGIQLAASVAGMSYSCVVTVCNLRRN